ncbi:hypothetical protein KPH14_006911 [Odynerus spinipes]|uniref:Uncharacterized protein n=1 Tax=Odynerus spinipes TaxID=1348599 RepID=A0AAD9RRE1_9HYME|nr:hypothetical protein KPH14_006911 [Odynerus spinipes]
MRKRRDIQHAKDINKKFALQEGLREILRHSLFTMQFHHENRLKYATSKSVEDFEILNQYFARWSSIIFVKENLKSLPLGRTNCCYHRDAMPPSDYTVNKSGELNTLFMNDTNNNLYCTSLCNDESISLLTNDIKLLPPSAFY